jgi:hypothetical protein
MCSLIRSKVAEGALLVLCLKKIRTCIRARKSKTCGFSSARVLSKEDKEQLAFLKKPIKSQPFTTFEDSLCRFTFNRVLERTADKDNPSPVIALQKSLATSTNAYDKMVLSIIACGDKNNAKDGLALCLKAVDYLDQHPQEANTPGTRFELFDTAFVWCSVCLDA